MPDRPRRAAVVLALASAIAVALMACGGPVAPSPSPASMPTPSPTPDETADPSIDPSDPLAVYARIGVQVEAIRGLEPTAAVTPVIIDEATLRANLAVEFDASNPADLIAANDRLLHALGLLEPGVGLRAAILDLNGSQVIGYYSSEAGSLYLVNRGGAVGATARVTYAHEYTHQLQDQRFDLDSLGLDAIDQGDRSLARLALVEGDATLTQTLWLTANLTATEIAELVRDASDPAVTAALERAPAFLVATSLFPYQDGGAFVGTIAGGGFGPVDAAYARLPDSTEQILHPDRYLAAEPPVIPTLDGAALVRAAGAGWDVGLTDTLGEFLLRVWLAEAGLADGEAAGAAEGWGGDRVALLDGPAGAWVVVLRTTWDSAADAAEFTDLLPTPAAGTGEVLRSVDATGLAVDVVFGTDAALVRRVAAALD